MLVQHGFTQLSYKDASSSNLCVYGPSAAADKPGQRCKTLADGIDRNMRSNWCLTTCTSVKKIWSSLKSSWSAFLLLCNSPSETWAGDNHVMDSWNDGVCWKSLFLWWLQTSSEHFWYSLTALNIIYPKYNMKHKVKVKFVLLGNKYNVIESWPF